LVALVAAFMALNSIGVYGFLSRARIAQTVTMASRVDGKAADVEARIEVQQGITTDLDRRIAQLDAMVQAATKRGYTRTAMRLVNDQAARRVDLERQREEAAQRLAGLQVEQAGVAGERKQADADLGPRLGLSLYLAKLFGSNDAEAVARLITALLVLVLTARRNDPATSPIGDTLVLIHVESRRQNPGLRGPRKFSNQRQFVPGGRWFNGFYPIAAGKKQRM
jgi:hypothetical protein